MDAAGDGQVKESIGTGPYRFVEHKPDRHIKVARFKDYSARADAPNGLGGKRVAYADEILFLPVPDVAVRLAGVETGEYHYGQQIKQDQYERIKSLPALEPRIIKPSALVDGRPQPQAGRDDAKTIRQAFQAALDMEPIMAAGFGNKAFYRLDARSSSPSSRRGTPRRAASCTTRRTPPRRKKLLKEAGYSGQPVRWITTKEYEWMYKNALVAKQQLEAAGFKVDLQVVDWATLVQRRNKPEVWDVFSTGITFNPEPALSTASRSATGRAGGVRTTRSSGWRHGPRDRRQEAQGHVGQGPGALLRGRRAGEVRRLVLARGHPQQRPAAGRPRASCRCGTSWLK